MLEKPKEEKEYGEAKLLKERCGTTLLSFSPSLLGFGLVRPSARGLLICFF